MNSSRSGSSFDEFAKILADAHSRRDVTKRLGALGLAAAGGLGLAPLAVAAKRKRGKQGDAAGRHGRDRGHHGARAGAAVAAPSPSFRGNGVYYVSTALTSPDGLLVLDVPDSRTGDGVKIQLYPFKGGVDEANQQWRLTKVGTNSAGQAYYTVVNVNSEKALDVPNGSRTPGLYVQQYQLSGGANQQWLLTPSGGGYRLTNRASGLILDAPLGGPNDRPASHDIVQQYPANGGPNQVWVMRWACADTYDSSNCGACGHVCPRDTACCGGGCHDLRSCF